MSCKLLYMLPHDPLNLMKLNEIVSFGIILKIRSRFFSLKHSRNFVIEKSFATLCIENLMKIQSQICPV